MEKPKPLATDTSRPFWEGLRAGEIRIQRCDACTKWIFYPRTHCPGCLSPRLTWTEVSGRGELHAFTIARAPTAAFFADDVPQKIAIVELDEGVRLTSTLIGVNEDEIAIGMRLEPVIEKVPETEWDEGVRLFYQPEGDSPA